MLAACYKALGVLVICVLAVTGRVLESSRCFIRGPLGTGLNARVLYDCLNVHLNLSLGMFGLLWGLKVSVARCMILVVLLLLGVASKSAFSQHRPDSLKMKDPDAFFGLWIPTFFGVLCVFYVAGLFVFDGGAS